MRGLPGGLLDESFGCGGLTLASELGQSQLFGRCTETRVPRELFDYSNRSQTVSNAISTQVTAVFQEHGNFDVANGSGMGQPSRAAANSCGDSRLACPERSRRGCPAERSEASWRSPSGRGTRRWSRPSRPASRAGTIDGLQPPTYLEDFSGSQPFQALRNLPTRPLPIPHPALICYPALRWIISGPRGATPMFPARKNRQAAYSATP
jgi:hypothetical protein